jgi:hypothetical protein
MNMTINTCIPTFAFLVIFYDYISSSLSPLLASSYHFFSSRRPEIRGLHRDVYVLFEILNKKCTCCVALDLEMRPEKDLCSGVPVFSLSV